MNKVKSLITTFRYPRLGPGMMWEAAAQKIQQQTSEIKLGATVTGLTLKGETWEINYQQNESEYKTTASEVISSMPLRELVNCLTPAVPNEIIKAANALRYRDFLVVALMTNCEGDFDDNWIYIHDPEVKVGRVQNFRSWSPDLIPEAGKNCYGLEYFCFEGDGLWDSSDEQLIELAIKEITQIGLAKREAITDGYVVRQAKAYPVYDADYQKNVKIIADYLEANYPTLHLVGRNGMHKYNNQDHAMMTAMLTAKNILSQSKQYDVWQVNQDAEYHESERLVPQKIQIAKQPSPAEQ
jgi:protoporphyrinogen oxidase